MPRSSSSFCFIWLLAGFIWRAQERTVWVKTDLKCNNWHQEAISYLFLLSFLHLALLPLSTAVIIFFVWKHTIRLKSCRNKCQEPLSLPSLLSVLYLALLSLSTALIILALQELTIRLERCRNQRWRGKSKIWALETELDQLLLGHSTFGRADAGVCQLKGKTSFSSRHSGKWILIFSFSRSKVSWYQ